MLHASIAHTLCQQGCKRVRKHTVLTQGLIVLGCDLGHHDEAMPNYPARHL